MFYNVKDGLLQRLELQRVTPDACESRPERAMRSYIGTGLLSFKHAGQCVSISPLSGDITTTGVMFTP